MNDKKEISTEKNLTTVNHHDIFQASESTWVSVGEDITAWEFMPDDGKGEENGRDYIPERKRKTDKKL